MASTGLLTLAALGFRVRRRGQPSVSVSICRVAVLGGSPYQLTFSQSSPSELWYGRQTAERPDPRVSACYLRTLRALTDHANVYGLGCPGLITGGINFGWLAVWVLSPDRLSRKQEVCDLCQALRWSRRAWRWWVMVVPRLCIRYPGIFLTTEKKSRKTLSQGNRRALGNAWRRPRTCSKYDAALPHSYNNQRETGV